MLETLTLHQVEALVASPEGNSFTHVRDHAILELCYSSGLSVVEVSRLSLRHVDADRALIYRPSSASSSEPNPLGTYAMRALLSYLDVRNKRRTKSDALFLHTNGKAVAEDGIRSLIEKALQHIGSGHIRPEALSASFAMHLFSRGAAVEVVRALVGGRLASVVGLPRKRFRNLKKRRRNRTA